MTFEEAQLKLEGIAGGRYYHLSYERTSYSVEAGGDLTQNCTVYVIPGASATRDTWDLAFQSLQAQLDGKHDPTLDLPDTGPAGELKEEPKCSPKET